MIHLVDDDEAVLRSLALLLRALGLPSRSFPSASTFLAALPGSAPTLLLLDLNMPGMNGVELCHALHAQGYSFPVVILTAQPDSPLLRGLPDAAVPILAKPTTLSELESTIRAAGVTVPAG